MLDMVEHPSNGSLRAKWNCEMRRDKQMLIKCMAIGHGQLPCCIRRHSLSESISAIEHGRTSPRATRRWSTLINRADQTLFRWEFRSARIEYTQYTEKCVVTNVLKSAMITKRTPGKESYML